MKMQVKKTTAEKVELELPAYFKNSIKNSNRFSLVTDRGVIEINQNLIIMWPIESIYFESQVEDILQNTQPCSSEEFEEAHIKFLQNFYEIKNAAPKMETA